MGTPHAKDEMPVETIAEALVSQWGLLGGDHDRAVDTVASALRVEREARQHVQDELDAARKRIHEIEQKRPGC
jgi:hypothetical protein